MVVSLVVTHGSNRRHLNEPKKERRDAAREVLSIDILGHQHAKRQMGCSERSEARASVPDRQPLEPMLITMDLP
jgi:hypothetical protein